MPGAVWDQAVAVDVGTRPGVYINFEAAAQTAAPQTADGAIFFIGVADWGPVGSAVKIESPAQVDQYLGTAVTATRRAFLEAFLQGVRTIYSYRIATGSAASAALTLNDGSAAAALTVTAKYPGTFGNSLRAEVVTNVLDNAKKDLIIREGTVKRETFTGEDNDALVADFVAKGSKYVTVALAGTANRQPANIAATPLTGGNSGTAVTSTDYTNALDAGASTPLYRVLTIDSADSSIQAAVSAWVKAQRDGGNRIKAVLGAGSADSLSTKTTQAAALDYEGTSLLASGATKQGVARTPVEMSIVVGAIVSVQDFQSVTNFTLEGYEDVSPKFTPAEYTAGLTKGLLILSTDRTSRVYIEQGLNTLQVGSAVPPKSLDWRKIRYVAIQDELVDRVNDYIGANYIGKVSNDQRGRDEAVNQVQTVLNQMVKDRLLLTGLQQNLDGTFTDVTPKAFLDPRFVSTADRVYVAISGKAADALEKFFITVAV